MCLYWKKVYSFLFFVQAIKKKKKKKKNDTGNYIQ